MIQSVLNIKILCSEADIRISIMFMINLIPDYLPPAAQSKHLWATSSIWNRSRVKRINTTKINYT